ncbi:MAG: hypothetical protein KAI79_04065 [Bacteroidales bacterium]|nr:hypothetical protein [Bacteroidales bacterium]
MITIACINYNSYNELNEFINSIVPYAKKYDIVVVIVDNSEQKPLNYVENITELNFVTYLNPGENIGYFGAAHFAYEYIYNLNNKIPEWFIISNVDILIKMDIFSYLKEVYSNKKYKNVCIFAPKILSILTGDNLNPYMIKKPLKKSIKRLLVYYSHYVLYNTYNIIAVLKRKVFKKNNKVFPEVVIYAGQGSFIIIKDIFFINGGSLKYQNFLFNEEVFLAEEVRRLNLDILYTNSMSVLHKEHISTGKYFRSKKIYNFHITSLKNIYTSYFDR